MVEVEEAEVAYPVALAAALGGVTEAQLAHWRRQPPVLVPEYGTRPRVRYSFRDLLAIRTVGRLRTEVSLQKIRRAVENLKVFDDFEHLSNYRLMAAGDTVVWAEGDQVVDLVKRPGQRMLVTMRDVLDEFTNRAGKLVVPLERPKPGVRIDPKVLGGFPVIDRTRVPYDTVASLVADGLDAKSISHFYPSVTATGVTGAVALDEYVTQYRQAA